MLGRNWRRKGQQYQYIYFNSCLYLSKDIELALTLNDKINLTHGEHKDEENIKSQSESMLLYIWFICMFYIFIFLHSMHDAI